jgi:pilus assembly protein CpaE
MNGGVDLLVLDGTTDPIGELDALERAQGAKRGLQTILLLQEQSTEVLLRALRMGIREVVAVSGLEIEVPPALLRLQRLTGDGGNRGCKVLSFFSCKGGSGATFLAANLGYALAQHSGTKVLLIDLNLQFGDAHLLVSDRKPTTSLADLSREIERVDLAFLKGSMIDVLPNYGLIPSPEDPAHAREVRPAHVDTLLALARAEFDYVILDLGRSLDPVTVRALDQSDFVMPVLQLTVPFVREAKRFLQLLRQLDYPAAKVRPLLNRHQKTGDLSLEDVTRALGMEVFATIPNHYSAVAASVNQGVPLSKLARSSPVSRALERLAESFRDRPEQRAGWLKKMMWRS